jgi:hypothetical protein
MLVGGSKMGIQADTGSVTKAGWKREFLSLYFARSGNSQAGKNLLIANGGYNVITSLWHSKL